MLHKPLLRGNAIFIAWLLLGNAVIDFRRMGDAGKLFFNASAERLQMVYLANCASRQQSLKKSALSYPRLPTNPTRTTES